MADGSERRVARRFTMSLPLRVLPRASRSQRTTRANSRRQLSGALFRRRRPIRSWHRDRICTDLAEATRADRRSRHSLSRANRPRRVDVQRTLGRSRQDRAIRIPACHRLRRLTPSYLWSSSFAPYPSRYPTLIARRPRTEYKSLRCEEPLRSSLTMPLGRSHVPLRSANSTRRTARRRAPAASRKAARHDPAHQTPAARKRK